MSLLDFKYYVDFKPLPSALAFLEGYENEQPLYTAYGGERFDIWKQLDEETNANSYEYNKYTKRAAVALEVLIPNCVLNNIKSFCELFVGELVGQSKLPAICFVTTKGKGTYLQIMICERRYFEESKEISIKFKANRYQNAKTGRLCKENDDDAVITVKKGDTKKKYLSNFSLKKRLFAIPKAEFKELLRKIKRIIFNSCQKLNTQIKKQYFFKTIKHKSIKRFFSKFVNRNIRAYNDIIKYMNEQISMLEDVIWSPAKYYQESAIVLAFKSIFFKYRQRIENKSFTYHDYKLSLSVFNRTDRFKENIESFIAKFEEDISDFFVNYITTL